MKKLILAVAILTIGSLSLEAKRPYCKNMKSCAEACMYLKKGYKSLDRDRDGIPCENVCSKPCKVEKSKKSGKKKSKKSKK